MELEEFEKANLKNTVIKAEVIEDDDLDDLEEPEALSELWAASALLRRCMHLMAYLSDVDCVKNLSKRERDALSRMSETVHTFVTDIGLNYPEDL